MSDKQKSTIFSIVEMAVVIAITVVVFKYIVIPVRINGVSMENTLQDNDIALVNAMSVKEENINRFDVVVIYSQVLDEKIIKRVIGLPGDTIEYKDDNLYINGEKTDQDFLDSDFVEKSMIKYNVTKFTDDFKVEVGEGKFFVMGDNRLRSTDSRELGSFSIEDFIGIKGMVIYPFSDIQWLG